MESYYTNDNNINGLSASARFIINEDLPEHEIDSYVFVKEFMNPDGDDADGPTREIWELYVYVDKNSEIEKHLYTYEYVWSKPTQRRYEYAGLVDDTMEAELLDRLNSFDYELFNTDEDSWMDEPPARDEQITEYEMEDLSREAQECIKNNFDRNNIQRVRESMIPDGSRGGDRSPKVEMWQLRIQTNDGTVHIFSYAYNSLRGEHPAYKPGFE